MMPCITKKTVCVHGQSLSRGRPITPPMNVACHSCSRTSHGQHDSPPRQGGIAARWATYILNDKANLGPVHIARVNQPLQEPTHTGQPTHDAVGKEKHDEVPPDHGLDDFIGAKRVAAIPPVLGSDLDHEQESCHPEQGEEAVEGAVGGILVLTIECRELLRKHQVAELGPGLRPPGGVLGSLNATP